MAGAGSETRQAVGPILFYTIEGSVTLYVQGVAVTLSVGASAKVQLGDLYALVNESETPATLLRLAVTPKDAIDAPVAIVITPAALLLTPVSAPPTGSLLFRAEISAYPTNAARLFLACVNWLQSGQTLDAVSSSGPVGLRVLQGSITIDHNRTLPETGCTLLEANVLYRVEDARADPIILAFGVIPEDQQLWQSLAPSVTAPPNPPDVSCGAAQ